MTASVWLTLGVGFVIGLRHATDADHVAAISTLVGEQRSLWRTTLLGIRWGIGHTASLMVAGALVIGAGVRIPEVFDAALEIAIAVMIVLLGGRVLYTLASSRTAGRTHETESVAARWRPVLIGSLHGLAGSGALTLLVMTEVTGRDSVWLSMAFLAVFGIGSIVGMLSMSTLMGLPFQLGSRASGDWAVLLRFGVGILGVLFGVFYGWQIVRTL